MKRLFKWFFCGLVLILAALIWGGVHRQLAFNELYRMVDQADELVVRGGEFSGDFQGKALFTSREKKDRTELKEAMVPVFWTIDDECSCLGKGTLKIFLYRDGKELTVISTIHDQSIRWSTRKMDTRLRDPQKWGDWFAARGIKRPE